MPTSGKSPMRVSGIAIFVESVTTRSPPVRLAACEMPIPPPITTPCISAIYGFGYVKIAWFSAYSSMKNVSIEA